MEEFRPKFSKVLVTPDPQYIPGYTGYCPQLKYQLGKTYGQMTAKLLVSPEVSRSRRLVLHTGRFPSTETDTGPRDEIWRSHHGDRRNLERMIPGYTGFVPKSRNYFARTYAETCREALTEFDREDSSPHKHFTSGYVPKSRFLIGSSYPITTNKALTQFGKEMKSGYLPPISSVYPSHRGLLPFYTGHVPGYKFKYGHTFGQLTHNSLELSGTQSKMEAQ